MNRHSLKVGFSFGLTSGVITTLGLIVGLHAGTNSQLVIIGGILVIAIADSFSDALGIHIAEESENKHTPREVWEATICTFLFKLVFALTFVVPILLFELITAIIISIFWGAFLLTILSFKLAKEQGIKPAKIIAEHLILLLIIISITHYVGDWVAMTFN